MVSLKVVEHLGDGSRHVAEAARHFARVEVLGLFHGPRLAEEGATTAEADRVVTVTVEELLALEADTD